MSWEGYCDSVQGRYRDGIDSVGLFGLDGSVYATKSYDCSLGEMPDTVVKGILNEMKKKEEDDSADMSGVHWGSIKFMTLGVEVSDADGKTFKGKKKEYGAIYAETTKSCIIVAHLKEGAQVGTMNTEVGKVCEHMRNNNY